MANEIKIMDYILLIGAICFQNFVIWLSRTTFSFGNKRKKVFSFDFSHLFRNFAVAK